MSQQRPNPLRDGLVYGEIGYSPDVEQEQQFWFGKERERESSLPLHNVPSTKVQVKGPSFATPSINNILNQRYEAGPDISIGDPANEESQQDGPVGPPGQPGSLGAIGSRGPFGTTGSTGPTGPMGPRGPEGGEGPIGPRGSTGSTGPAGATGPTGSSTGSTGNKGIDGPQGGLGPTGPRGITGPVGSSGIQGILGSSGPTGPRGPECCVCYIETGHIIGLEMPTACITACQHYNGTPGMRSAIQSNKLLVGWNAPNAAGGTITFTAAAEVGEDYSVTIEDYAGAEVVYREGWEWSAGGSASESAANLKAAIEGAGGHDGHIIVEQENLPGTSILTLTQAENGASGNTTITKVGDNILVTGFTQGEGIMHYVARRWLIPHQGDIAPESDIVHPNITQLSTAQCVNLGIQSGSCGICQGGISPFCNEYSQYRNGGASVVPWYPTHIPSCNIRTLNDIPTCPCCWDWYIADIPLGNHEYWYDEGCFDRSGPLGTADLRPLTDHHLPCCCGEDKVAWDVVTDERDKQTGRNTFWPHPLYDSYWSTRFDHNHPDPLDTVIIKPEDICRAVRSYINHFNFPMPSGGCTDEDLDITLIVLWSIDCCCDQAEYFSFSSGEDPGIPTSGILEIPCAGQDVNIRSTDVYGHWVVGGRTCNGDCCKTMVGCHIPVCHNTDEWEGNIDNTVWPTLKQSLDDFFDYVEPAEHIGGEEILSGGFWHGTADDFYGGGGSCSPEQAFEDWGTSGTCDQLELDQGDDNWAGRPCGIIAAVYEFGPCDPAGDSNDGDPNPGG